jgi:nucleotide-binding universal stress UspA family protein
VSIKTILVPVNSGTISRSPLDLAFMTAAKFQAHVDVLHVRPDPRNMIPYVGEGMSGALIEEVMGAADREAGDRANAVHTLFNEYLTSRGVHLASVPQAGAGVTASWIEDAGRDDEAVTRYGRLTDLIVVNRPLKEAEVPTTTVFEAALFETGQPLLVAPPDPVADFGENIMIAWNGSPEATGAVSAAIPFLTRAKRVSIMSATAWGEGMLSVEGVAHRLSWHGVQVDVKTIGAPDRPVGEIVLAEAASRGADMIVMGAYTQSRLRQMILGGVTRHVLSYATIPLLMSH